MQGDGGCGQRDRELGAGEEDVRGASSREMVDRATRERSRSAARSWMHPEPCGAAMLIGASGVTAKLSARGDRSGHGMVENLAEGRAGRARRLAVRHL